MTRSDPHAGRVRKVLGRDVEFSNAILGLEDRRHTGGEASRRLLAELSGHAADGHVGSATSTTYGAANPQDQGRRYLGTMGTSFYIDMDHLEATHPETADAFGCTAIAQAVGRLVRRAMDAANDKLPAGQRLLVLANNSDGAGHSYGAHLSFLITRALWQDLFHRRLHVLAHLMSFQVSSIVYGGQGKVGAENGAPAVDYQLTQRGDFFEDLLGERTTFARPLVNTRDESLCGRDAADRRLARLHCIFYDHVLCPVAATLQVGVMQLILCLLEGRCCDTGLILDHPLAALRQWGHDPSLTARARLVDGRRLTVVEHQLLFHEHVAPRVEAGECDPFVPHARRLLGLWGDTLDHLRARRWDRLVGRLDWVLKRTILERAIDRNRALQWHSADAKMLDHLYAALDDRGLFRAYERQGLVDQVVDERRIATALHEPPTDTRAWTRAMVLRAVEADGRASVRSIDWDSIRVRLDGREWWDWEEWTLNMSDPTAYHRAAAEPVFRRSTGLGDLMTALRALHPEFHTPSWQRPDAAAPNLLPVATTGSASKGHDDAQRTHA